MSFKESDTTLRARRDESIDASAFDQLETEAHAACDRIIKLDLDVVVIDGSLPKAQFGGEGTGPERAGSPVPAIQRTCHSPPRAISRTRFRADPAIGAA